MTTSPLLPPEGACCLIGMYPLHGHLAVLFYAAAFALAALSVAFLVRAHKVSAKLGRGEVDAAEADSLFDIHRQAARNWALMAPLMLIAGLFTQALAP